MLQSVLLERMRNSKSSGEVILTSLTIDQRPSQRYPIAMFYGNKYMPDKFYYVTPVSESRNSGIVKIFEDSASEIEAYRLWTNNYHTYS